MIKTNGQIKELGPRNAVYWWLYCNGGGNKVRVYAKLHTTFINEHGDILILNDVISFRDARFYTKWFVDTNMKELCGEEEE